MTTLLACLLGLLITVVIIVFINWLDHRILPRLSEINRRRRGYQRKKLTDVGWFPGRDVFHELTLPAGLEVFPAAKRVLSEFGNLEWGTPDSSVCLDPSVADKVVDAIHDYEKQLGSHLYPLGCDDCVFFLIDGQGHIYAMDNTLDPLASSFEHA